jgi:cation diffusion facilitator family transporter
VSSDPLDLDWAIVSLDKVETAKVRSFYHTQNELIHAVKDEAKAYRNFSLGISEDTDDDAASSAVSSRRAAQLSFAVNFVLLVIKFVAAILSGSLSVIASLIDSVLDLFSGIVFWRTGKMVEKEDIYAFPVGKQRLKAIAVIIVASVMGTASLSVLFQAIKDIIAGADAPTIDVTIIVLVALTVVVKILLMIHCRAHDTPETRALSVDHQNDSVSNSVALVCSILAERYWAPIDPLGAIALSLFIIYSWTSEGGSHVVNIV